MFLVNPLLGRGFTWKNQTLFSSEGKSKKLKCRLLQFLFGALWISFPEIQDDLSIVSADTNNVPS